MINKNDFLKQIERLTSVFSNISEEAFEEYYNKFKFFELNEIEDAVGMLIIDHKGEFTPKPAELLGMINEIRKQSSSLLPGEEAPAPICDVCDGTGFKTWIEKGHLKATPCIKCAKGKGIVNAPAIRKPYPEYPSGWREAYQKHKGRKKGKYEKEVHQAMRGEE